MFLIQHQINNGLALCTLSSPCSFWYFLVDCDLVRNCKPQFDDHHKGSRYMCKPEAHSCNAKLWFGVTSDLRHFLNSIMPFSITGQVKISILQNQKQSIRNPDSFTNTFHLRSKLFITSELQGHCRKNKRTQVYARVYINFTYAGFQN